MKNILSVIEELHLESLDVKNNLINFIKESSKYLNINFGKTDNWNAIRFSFDDVTIFTLTLYKKTNNNFLLLHIWTKKIENKNIQDKIKIWFPNKNANSKNSRHFFQNWDNTDKIEELLEIIKKI